MIRLMLFKLSAILSITAAIFKDRADLVAENMALRHQLSCSINREHRPRLRPVDRVFWVLLSFLEWLEGKSDHSEASHGFGLASQGLQTLLAVEESKARSRPAEWTAQQLVEACPFDLASRFLIRDNDKIYGKVFRDRVDGRGLEQIRTAFRSPWQNGFAERWIASLRRDCLDHVIPINERQLRRVIRSYVDYYHADRTHLGLEKDAPEERPIEPREIGAVVAFPRAGGLHHRYSDRKSVV